MLLKDSSVATKAREEIAKTIALMAFLASSEPSDVTDALTILHKVFSDALPKGNGELPTHNSALMALHTSSLQGFCLLLPILSLQYVYERAPKLLLELLPVLDSPDVDQRIMVGEAIALIYETARLFEENFRLPKGKETDLVNMLLSKYLIPPVYIN